MNLEKNYFHFLNGNAENENISKICLNRLESILKTGYILSRNMQIKLLGNYEMGVEELNWNGFDNISICIKTNHNEYNIAFKEYTDEDLNAYNLFAVNNSICIILESTLLKNKDIILDYPIYYLPGEFQVKHKIPLKYFSGIGIKYDLLNIDYELSKKIAFLLNKYNIDLPILDLDNCQKVYLKK